MCDEQTIAQLIKDLGGNHYSEAQAANKKLVECGQPAVEPLIAALQTRNIHTKPDNTLDMKLIAIVSVLCQIGDERAIEPIINIFQFIDDTTASSFVLPLTKFGSKIVEPLIHALKSDNVALREVAASTLSNVRDKRAVEPLIAALNDHEDSIRRIVCDALGNLGDPRAVEALSGILYREKNENVRQNAAMALEDIRDERVIEPLIYALRSDKDPEIRRLAAHALQHYPSEEVVKALIAALHDDAAVVPMGAKYALGNMPEQARPYLKQLHKEHPQLIERAFNTWPWEWVTASRESTYSDLKAQLERITVTWGDKAEQVIAFFYARIDDSCPICGKAANELAWFYVSTPPKTWEMLAGRAGWLAVCDDCHLQVNFFMGEMS